MKKLIACLIGIACIFSVSCKLDSGRDGETSPIKILSWDFNDTTTVPLDPKLDQYHSASVMKAEDGVLKLKADKALWTEGWTKQNLIDYTWQFDFRYADYDIDWGSANFALRCDAGGGGNKVVLSVVGNLSRKTGEQGQESNPAGGELSHNLQLWTFSSTNAVSYLASTDIPDIYDRSWYTFRIVAKGSNYSVWVWPRDEDRPMEPTLSAATSFRGSGDVAYFAWEGGERWLDNIILYNSADVDLDNLPPEPAEQIFFWNFNDGAESPVVAADGGIDENSYIKVENRVLKLKGANNLRTRGWAQSDLENYFWQFDYMYGDSGTSARSAHIFLRCESPTGRGYRNIYIKIASENDLDKAVLSEANPAGPDAGGAGVGHNLQLVTGIVGSTQIYTSRDSTHIPGLYVKNSWYTYRIIVKGYDYKIWVWPRGEEIPNEPTLSAVINDFAVSGSDIGYFVYGGAEKWLDNVVLYKGTYVTDEVLAALDITHDAGY